MVSLRMALKGREQQPAIVCNGDVVFEPSIAASLAKAPYGDLICVEAGRYIEESMKVTVDADERITAISKTIPASESFGVSIDLYRFSARGIETICVIADRFIEQEHKVNLWSEVAIDAALSALAVRPLRIAGPWMEVDNLQDLADGERVFAEIAC
jgi:choline kinase